MAPPQLTTLTHPIAINPQHVAAEQTRLRIKQQSMSFSGGDFTVFREGAIGEEQDAPLTNKLFTSEGKAMSWRQRRTVYDASGLPVFEVYRKSSGVTWYVHVPGDQSINSRDGDACQGMPLVEFRPQGSVFKDKLDINVCSRMGEGGGEGEMVKLEVRGQDIWKIRTNVYWGDSVVMTAKRQDKLAVYLPGKSLEWVVDVAQGMDISLVSHLAHSRLGNFIILGDHSC